MKRVHPHDCDQEHEFALIVGGVADFDQSIEDALFEAGCDDATISLQRGRLYLEFSRCAPSLEAAILSAIKDIRKSGIGGEVLRVDECDLVTQAEIARRIKRTRQLVAQYITGERGPGGFPLPDCHILEKAPLWRWCAVSWWLVQNNIIKREDGWNAQVVAAINTWLESDRQKRQNPGLFSAISHGLAKSK